MERARPLPLQSSFHPACKYPERTRKILSGISLRLVFCLFCEFVYVIFTQRTVKFFCCSVGRADFHIAMDVPKRLIYTGSNPYTIYVAGD